MDTRTYLSQLRGIDRKIQNRINDARRWREIAYGNGSASNMNENKVQTSKVYDRMGDAISVAVDAERESLEAIRVLATTKYTIEKQICEIPTDKSYAILHAFYMDGMSMPQIMETQFYSKSQAYKVFDDALTEFEQKFGETYL